MPNSKIWDTDDKNCWFYERAKLSYFQKWHLNRAAKRSRDINVSLCVKGQTNMAKRKKTERTEELLDNLVKLSDSEPLDIFLTSEFLLKSKVYENLNTQTDITTR